MSIKRKRLSLGMVKTQGRLWNIFSNFLHFNLYKQENIFCYVLSVIRCECYNLKVIGSYQLWSWEHKIILFYLPSIFSTTNSADFNQAIHTYISTFPWKSHFSTAIINPVLFAIFTIVYLLFFSVCYYSLAFATFMPIVHFLPDNDRIISVPDWT